MYHVKNLKCYPALYMPRHVFTYFKRVILAVIHFLFIISPLTPFYRYHTGRREQTRKIWSLIAQ